MPFASDSRLLFEGPQKHLSLQTNCETAQSRPGSTIAVIDMQSAFYASQDRQTINNVRLEIMEAKQRGSGIVIVEFNNCGQTNPTIMELLADYDETGWDIARKDKTSGAFCILKACCQKRFDLNKVRVMGVNTRACVKATAVAIAMISRSTTVEVVQDACNDAGLGHKAEVWKDFSSLPNLFLV